MGHAKRREHDWQQKETWRPSGIQRRADIVPGQTMRVAKMAIPRRVIGWEALVGCDLERDDVFVLALVDGMTPLDTVLDMTGFSPARAAAAVRRLLELGILVLDD